MLSLGLTMMRGGGGGENGPPVSADFTITSDADWASVIALAAASTGAKTVRVAAGSYTKKTVSLATGSMITFVGDGKNLTVIDQLVLDSAVGVTFRDMMVLTSLWQSAPSPPVEIKGACDDWHFKDCRIRGNYRGNTTDRIDTLADLPEYACITATIAGGQVTVLDHTARPFVGDLVGNGVHPLTLLSTGGTGFSGTMTVLDGYITSTAITTAGSGYNTSLHTTARITWAGQQRMTSYLQYGIQKPDGSASSGAFSVVDCEFWDLQSGVKLGISGEALVRGCKFDGIYCDTISLGLENNIVPPRVTILDNFYTRIFSKAGDAGDPHADAVIQLFFHAGRPAAPTPSQYDWPGLTVERNVLVNGAARGGAQGVFISVSPSVRRYIKPRIVGNIVASAHLTNSIMVGGAWDAFIWRNLSIRYDPTDSSGGSATINLGTSGEFEGQSLLGRNIGEAIIIKNLTHVDQSSYPNLTVGKGGANVAYSAVFEDHDLPPTTLEEAIAAYTVKGAYSAFGPLNGDGYIDYLARTTDRSMEPTFARWRQVINQPVGSLIESDWSPVLGGLPGRAISAGPGVEYRIADDRAATNVTAWTSAPGTVDPGQYVQRRHTSSATNNATTSTNLTINGQVFPWAVATESATAYPLADNGNSAWSKVASPVATATGQRKFLIAGGFLFDAVATNMRVFGVAGQVFNMFVGTGGVLRFSMINSTILTAIANFTITAGVYCRYAITVDFTKKDPSEVIKIVVNGELASLNFGTGTNDSTVDSQQGDRVLSLATLFSSDLGLFGYATGANLMDGQQDLWLFDSGDGSYILPDIADPAVFGLLSPDILGANVTALTGALPRLCYFGPKGAGDGSEVDTWNATGGLPNRGGGGVRPLIKQAGVFG